MANEFTQNFDIIDVNIKKSTASIKELLGLLQQLQKTGQSLQLGKSFEDLDIIAKRLARDLNTLSNNKDFIDIASVNKANDKLEDTRRAITNIVNSFKELDATGSIDLGGVNKLTASLKASQQVLDTIGSKAKTVKVKETSINKESEAKKALEVEKKAAQEAAKASQEAADKQAAVKKRFEETKNSIEAQRAKMESLRASYKEAAKQAEALGISTTKSSSATKSIEKNIVNAFSARNIEKSTANIKVYEQVIQSLNNKIQGKTRAQEIAYKNESEASNRAAAQQKIAAKVAQEAAQIQQKAAQEAAKASQEAADKQAAVKKRFEETKNSIEAQRAKMATLKESYKEAAKQAQALGINTTRSGAAVKNIEQNAAKLKDSSSALKAYERVITDVNAKIKEKQRLEQEAAKTAQEAAEKEKKAVQDAADKRKKAISGVATSINQIGTASYQLGMQATQVLKLREAFNMLRDTVSKVKEYTAQIQDVTVQLEVKTGGDTQKALNLVNELQEFANNTPLMMTDLSNSVNLLVNYGVEIDDVMQKVKQIGDLSRGQADTLNRISLAYGQVVSKQKLMAEEIRQFTEAGVPLRKYLMETMNVTGLELDKLLKRGRVTIDQFYAAMDSMTEAGGQFNGVLEKMSQTMNGLESTVRDKLLSLGKDLMNSGFEEYRDLLKSIIDMIDNFKGTKEFSDIQEAIGENAEEVFDRLEEILKELVNNADKLVDIINTIGKALIWVLDNPMKTLGIILFPAILGMASNLVVILMGIVGVTKGAAAAMSQFGVSTGIAQLKAGGMLTTFKAMAGPIGIIAATMGLIVAETISAAKYLKDLDFSVAVEGSQKVGENLRKVVETSSGEKRPDNAKIADKNRSYYYLQMNAYKEEIELAKSIQQEIIKANNDIDEARQKRADILGDKKTYELNETEKKELEDISYSISEQTKARDNAYKRLNKYGEMLLEEQSNGKTILENLYKTDKQTAYDFLRLLTGTDYYEEIAEKLLGSDLVGKIKSGEGLSEADKNSINSMFERKVHDPVLSVFEYNRDKLNDSLDLSLNLKYKLNLTVDESIEEETLKSINKDLRDVIIPKWKDNITDIEKKVSEISNIVIKPTIESDISVGEINNIRTELENLVSAIQDEQDALNETMLVTSDNSETYKELETRQGELSNRYNEATKQLTRLNQASEEYYGTLKEISKIASYGNVIRVDYSDLDAAEKQLEYMKEMGLVEGQIANSSQSIKAALSIQLREYEGQSNIIDTLTTKLDNYGNSLKNSGLEAEKLQSKALIGIRTIVENALNTSGLELTSTQIGLIASSVYDDAFAKFISDTEKRTEEARQKAEDAKKKAEQEREQLFSNKMSEYTYETEIGILDTLEKQLSKLKEIRKYAYSIEDIRQSDLDLLNKQKEILNKQLSDAKTLYDINKASRDTMNNYSKSWIEHSVYTKAIDDMEELEAHQRVFNRKQLDILDQIAQKQKQIALIRQNSSMTELERIQEISSINNDIRSMNAEIMDNQDEIAKKREEVYKNTLYEEIQKLYDYELNRIDEVVKARQQKKEDKTFEERKKEIEAEIELYSTSVSKEGQKKLDELRKELKSLEEDYSDTLFDRQVEDEKNRLEEKKTAEEKAADESAFNFGQKYGEALNNELELGLEKVRTSFGSGATIMTDSLSGYFKTTFIQDLIKGINEAFKGVNTLISGNRSNINDNRTQTNNFYNTTYAENNSSTGLFFNTSKSYGSK